MIQKFLENILKIYIQILTLKITIKKKKKSEIKEQNKITVNLQSKSFPW